MRRGSRIAALVVGAALIAAWGIGGGVDETEASWTDQEFARTTLTATTIPNPVIQSCVLSPGTLGTNPTITMKWNFPAGTGYAAPANVAYAVAEGGLLSNLTVALLGQGITTSGPVSGTYTTTFSSSLLGGLLGGSYGLYLQTVDATGWTSGRAGATAAMGLVGANPTCAPNPT
ncbi:hypothetical protein [Agreia bicolorata]|uniref:Ig-like domain-containing protein n=1 Tax=Agreia bicolorata TaxID=110935 RepID=A0ABR5CEN0_9MICO|nr:hypothetical protein [Agreia bicolorata]KJC64060.1 hypothetical protein TZ00_10935 [Agreia bicolorata]